MPRFHAMGTEVEVHAPGEDERAAALDVARCFAEEELRFSRFDATSELSALNRASGPVAVSPQLFEALAAARRWHARTGGLFDPGLGGAVCALGYGRTFSPGALDSEVPDAPALPASITELGLDEASRMVQRPAHLHVDLGGLIKGRTVDRAVARWRRARLAKGPLCLAIDAGGDAALVGDPGDGGWLVDVEDPTSPERVLLTLRVRDRSVATSAPNRRTWRRAGRRHHHLVDPRTGQPSTSDLAQVTVIAPSTEEADVLAKTIFLLGERGGLALVEARPSIGAVLVGGDGRLVVVGSVEVARA